jgi:hypothetical protein
MSDNNTPMELNGNDFAPFVPPGAAKESRIIRIVDGRYNLQFEVEDGGFITVDGKGPYQLRYMDETHFQVVHPDGHGQYFHICQFGETVIDRGNIVAKMNKEQAQ